MLALRRPHVSSLHARQIQQQKVKMTEEAMRVMGYSDCKAADMTLQMQVCCAIQKIKGEVSLHPKTVAAYLLLTLTTAATAARPKNNHTKSGSCSHPPGGWG
jgi:hypothetical protein